MLRKFQGRVLQLICNLAAHKGELPLLERRAMIVGGSLFRKKKKKEITTPGHSLSVLECCGHNEGGFKIQCCGVDEDAHVTLVRVGAVAT